MKGCQMRLDAGLAGLKRLSTKKKKIITNRNSAK
jgi:hypothetical protein